MVQYVERHGRNKILLGFWKGDTNDLVIMSTKQARETLGVMLCPLCHRRHPIADDSLYCDRCVALVKQTVPSALKYTNQTSMNGENENGKDLHC